MHHLCFLPLYYMDFNGATCNLCKKFLFLYYDSYLKKVNSNFKTKILFFHRLKVISLEFSKKICERLLYCQKTRVLRLANLIP